MSVLPVTVVVSVFNEELNLPACLAALHNAFSEVVVVDSGSTDRTSDIAVSAGAKILNFHWNGSFPKKRNWTLLNHTFKTPWVLFLDADECVTPAFIDELRRTLPQTSQIGFWISFTNWFMGSPLRHGDTFRKLALFRVGFGLYERISENGRGSLDMEVHEHPILCGSIGKIASRIHHRDLRSLTHYKQKHAEYADWEAQRFLWLQTVGELEWSQLTPRQKFKYKNLDQWWLGVFYFGVSYLIRLGFLDRVPGFHLAWLKWRYFKTIRLKIRDAQQKAI